MPKLHIFVIHSEHLKLRAMHIHGVMQTIRLAALAEKYEVNIRLVLSPTSSQIESNLTTYQNEVNYDPVHNPLYDNFRVVLSSEMLSNTMKHLDVWKRIANMQETNPNDLFMVMEDDVFAAPDINTTFRALLQCVQQQQSSWDLIMLGLTTNENNVSTIGLRPMSTLTTVLPCKDSYFITRATARRCLADWKKHKFIMRIQWSYWFSQNPDVKVCIPSKRIFLDASKLGIMPSSIHANNMLIFNREFVELTKIAGLQEKYLKTKMKEAEQLYTAVLHMNSPDVMSVYGGILMKSGKLNEAKIMFMNALEILKVHNCKVNSAGDLYQNLINIHEKLQTDVAKITSQPSIYDDKDMAKADLS